jgi:hypothetical protein
MKALLFNIRTVKIGTETRWPWMKQKWKMIKTRNVENPFNNLE